MKTAPRDGSEQHPPLKNIIGRRRRTISTIYVMPIPKNQVSLPGRHEGCFPSCFPWQPLEDGLVGDNFVKIDGFVAVGTCRVALGLVIEAEFAEGVGLVADDEGGI